MKKNIKRAIGIIITILLTIAILSVLTDLMERKDSDIKYSKFFSEKQDFDVLFFGTSHMMNAVLPMELWRNYGITSYNCAGPASHIPTSYWVMENTFDYKLPKVVVIDCHTMSAMSKTFRVFSYTHVLLDAFPLSVTKVKAIWDLLDDPDLDAILEKSEISESDEPQTRLGLLWNYSVYHSRWNDLEREDIYPGESIEKGADSRINVCKGKFDKISGNTKKKTESTGEKYLRKMIEDCQSRNIDVVLTYLPYLAGDSVQERANGIQDIADEYGVRYINYLNLDLVNYSTDMYDETEHLNASGAKKVTDYIGRYLVNEFNLEDKRSDLQYTGWNDDYTKYEEFKDDRITSEETISNYLMLLSGEDLDVQIDIFDETALNNELLTELINNIKDAEVNICTMDSSENKDSDSKSKEKVIHIVVNKDNEKLDEVSVCEKIDTNTDIGEIKVEREADDE